MNYRKIRNNLITSLDFNECCIKKTKLISKLKDKIGDRPMSLGEKMAIKEKQ